MKKLNYILAIMAGALFASCEKTLELDYDKAGEEVLVVQGNVSNEGIYVTLNALSNVTDSVSTCGLDGAEVSVAGSDGYEETLVYGDGRYYSPTNAVGVPGVTYTLHVKRGANECYAKSTMPNPTPIDSVRYKWLEMFGDVDIFMLYIYFNDNPDTEDYHLYSVERNGKTVRFYCAPDEGLSDVYNYRYIDLNTKLEWKEDEREKKEFHGMERTDVIYGGNSFNVSLRTVDKNTYRFFSSGDFNGSGVNPTSNLVGNNCVGYFSAYSVDKRSMVMPTYDEALKMK